MGVISMRDADGRAACQMAMRNFELQEGVVLDWQEHDRGDRVEFVGTAPDGRQAGIAYMKGAPHA